MSDKNPDTLVMRLKSDIDITEEKYPELYKDEEFGNYLKLFKIILMFPYQEAHREMVKSIFKFEKDEYVTYIKNAEKILSIVGADEEFAREFGIDTDGMRKALEAKINKYETDIKKQRATSQYALHSHHIRIFKKLNSFGWGQTAQINFMYELYMECNYLNCRTIDEDSPNEYSRDISRKSLLGRIRKSQEKVFKESK